MYTHLCGGEANAQDNGMYTAALAISSLEKRGSTIIGVESV